MNAEAATQTALLSWFGSKRTLSSEIIHQLGPHRAYWETFCGGMAVLLAKPPASQETVNDLHGDLVNLARVIQDEALCGQLFWRLRRTLPAEELFRTSRALVRVPRATDDVDLDRAYHYFVWSWLTLGGTAGTRNAHGGFATRYTSRGGDPGARFVAAVESLPWWHERLRRVCILRRDGIDLCTRIEDALGTVIYCDPPYLTKGAEYQHDFANEDHRRLAAALVQKTKTRVVVSYYDAPELAEMYPAWHKVSLATLKRLVNGRKGASGRTTAPEVLLINGDPIPELVKEPANG